MTYRLTPPPMNPLSRLLAGILAVLMLVGAFFFGLFVLVVAVALGLAVWFALTLRLWWVRRRMDREGGAGSKVRREDGDDSGREGEVIDADYRVVSRRREE